jgi:hypothetical protein
LGYLQVIIQVIKIVLLSYEPTVATEKRAVLTLDGARLSRDGELRAATDVGVRFCVLKSTYTSP